MAQQNVHLEEFLSTQIEEHDDYFTKTQNVCAICQEAESSAPEDTPSKGTPSTSSNGTLSKGTPSRGTPSNAFWLKVLPPRLPMARRPRILCRRALHLNVPYPKSPPRSKTPPRPNPLTPHPRSSKQPSARTPSTAPASANGSRTSELTTTPVRCVDGC